MTPPTSETIRGVGSALVDDDFAPAQRALIVRHLPLFAMGWLGLGAVLRSGLIVRSQLAVGPALVSFALQVVVFAVAMVLCRADPGSPRVVPVVLASCMTLLVLATGFFAASGGSIEVLAFALFTICVGSSVAFAWGWGRALLLLIVAGVVSVMAAPSLRFFSDPTEILLEVLIGSAISITIAEVSERSLRRSFDQQRARTADARRLAAAHDAYRDLAENARDLIYTHDLDGRLVYVNEAFARCYGVPAADLIGRGGTTLVPHDATNPDQSVLRARLVAGEEIPPQLFVVKGPQGRRWLECSISAIHDSDGRIIGARGIARDVTERHAAEEALRASLEELRRSEERLRRLASHQAGIREAERKRLGFDLHDDVCQELVGIGILVESVRRRLVGVAPDLEAELARVSGYVSEVGEHLRQVAHDLRPMMLRDLGLEGSLRSLAEGMTTTGAAVVAVFPTPIPRLDEQVEIGVYRIAQEALANAVRHAAAGTIRVSVTVRDLTLELEIVDDGCGFLLEARRSREALGLVGMEERAFALGGHLELRSAPGRGTAVRLTCPVALSIPVSAA